MPQFNTHTGFRRMPVTVEYDIVDGSFTTFYVLIYHHDGPEDIAGYLSSEQYDFLQYQAQIEYRERAIISNASLMRSKYASPLDEAFDSWVDQH